MVGITYQLMLEEYREGYSAVQKRYTKRLTAESRSLQFRLWAILIG
jgi:hypothetical protein